MFSKTLVFEDRGFPGPWFGSTALEALAAATALGVATTSTWTLNDAPHKSEVPTGPCFSDLAVAF